MTNEKNYAGLIPDEHDGWAITATSVRSEKDTRAAKALFELAAGRLLDVTHWGSLLKGKLAGFALTDATGNIINGPAREGCFFKIDIIGPGSPSGDGYDWVRVEAVEHFEKEDIEHIAIRVRPASNPGNDDDTTAHFYDEKATSTFTVTREGSRVTASIYDRNTGVNKKGEGFLEKTRNAFFGLISKLAFSKMQWQDLTDGLLTR